MTLTFRDFRTPGFVAAIVAALLLGGAAPALSAPHAAKKKHKKPAPVASFAQSQPVAPDSTATAIATCPPTKTLVGGGFGSGPLSENFGTLVYESHREGANAWKISAANTDLDDPGSVSAYAYCRKGAAPLVESSATVNTSCLCVPKIVVVATCPDGGRAVAGGFLSPFDNTNGGVLPQGSRRFGAFAWRFDGLDDGATPRDVTSYAYCAPKARLETSGVRVIEGTGAGGTAYAPLCRRRGQKMLAGGFAAEPFDFLGSSLQLVASSMREAGRFASNAVETGIGPGTVTSYGYCG